MRKNKLNFFLNRATVTAAIYAAIVFIVCAYFVTLLKTADYFKIKDIAANEDDTEGAFSYLKGRGIFNIDLKKETGYISGLYPAYKKVRLVRILPDRLAVYFSRRSPVAYVKLYRVFCVDAEGVLFDPYSGQEAQELPVITGLETKIFGAKSGGKYAAKELRFALAVLEQIRQNPGLEGYPVKRLDVANTVNTTCFLSLVPGKDFLEVRLGQNNVQDKISILSGMLMRMKKDLVKIKYVDLRFREPVVKLK